MQLARAHASKLVDEDDDPIVDNNEIDTNNNLDSDWALTVPKTYRSADLKKWRQAPVIQNSYGRPGEMGKFNSFDSAEFGSKDASSREKQIVLYIFSYIFT